MSQVLQFFREREPRLKDVSDDDLSRFIADKYPEFKERLDSEIKVKSEPPGRDRTKYISTEPSYSMRSVAPSEAGRQVTYGRIWDADVVDAGPAPSEAGRQVTLKAPVSDIDNPLKSPEYRQKLEFDKRSEEFQEEGQEIMESWPKPPAHEYRDRGFIESMTTPIVENMPKVSGRELETLGMSERAAKITAGVQRGIADAVQFFTSPLGVSTLGTSLLPKAAQRAVAAAFAADMARHSPGIASELGEAVGKGDDQKTAEMATHAVLNTFFIVQGARHAAGFPRPKTVGQEASEWIGKEMLFYMKQPSLRRAMAEAVEREALDALDPLSAQYGLEVVERQAHPIIDGPQRTVPHKSPAPAVLPLDRAATPAKQPEIPAPKVSKPIPDNYEDFIKEFEAEDKMARLAELIAAHPDWVPEDYLWRDDVNKRAENAERVRQEAIEEESRKAQEELKEKIDPDAIPNTYEEFVKEFDAELNKVETTVRYHQLAKAHPKWMDKRFEERKADFARRIDELERGKETPAPKEPDAPILPEYPKKMSFPTLGEKGKKSREAWVKARDDYNIELGAFEQSFPKNKPIILDVGNDAVVAITPDPQGGFRATRFSKAAKVDALMPMGHGGHKTRLAALQDVAKSHGSQMKLIDKLPKRVMDEKEVKGYVHMKDVEGQELVWYKMKEGKDFQSFVHNNGIQGLVIDSMDKFGRFAVTKKATEWFDNYKNSIEKVKTPAEMEEIIKPIENEESIRASLKKAEDLIASGTLSAEGKKKYQKIVEKRKKQLAELEPETTPPKKPYDYVSNQTDRESFLEGVIQAAQDLENGSRIVDDEMGVTWTIKKRVAPSGTEFIEFDSDAGGLSTFTIQRKMEGKWKVIGNPNHAFSDTTRIIKPSETDQHWIKSLPEIQRESVYAAMREIERRVSYTTKERSLRPGRGEIPAGAAGFDEFVIVEFPAEVMRRINKGDTLEQAEVAAKKYAQESVAKHNSKRKKDINWQRDKDFGASYIDRTIAHIRESLTEKKSTPPPAESEVKSVQQEAEAPTEKKPWQMTSDEFEKTIEPPSDFDFNPKEVTLKASIRRLFNSEMRLSNAINAPDLFKKFPLLDLVKIEGGPTQQNKHGAYFDPDKNTITLGVFHEELALRAIVHEIQHAIDFSLGKGQNEVMAEKVERWYSKSRLNAWKEHEAIVRQAHKEGKPVPHEVLAEYKLEKPAVKKPTESDINSFLSVPVPDVATARIKIKADDLTVTELRKEYLEREKVFKELDKKVRIKTGPKWKRDQIKKSANKKDLTAYNAVSARMQEIRDKLEKLERGEDRAAVENAEFARRVNDESLPLLSRLIARSAMPSVGKLPKALQTALQTAISKETTRVIKEEIPVPDASQEEITDLQHTVQASYHHADGRMPQNVWDLIQAKRRLKLENRVTENTGANTAATTSDFTIDEISKGLWDDIGKYTDRFREFADRKGPVEPISNDKLSELTERLQAERKVVSDRRLVEEEKAQKAAAEMEVKLTKVIKTENAADAAAAKRILLRELETALKEAPEEMVGRAKITIEIPGDGTFKIANHKKAIATVIEKANAIETGKGPYQSFTESQPSVEKGKEWMAEADTEARIAKGDDPLIAKARGLEAIGKLKWIWSGEKKKAWVPVEGKPIEFPEDANRKYFTTKVGSEWAVSEESTGIRFGDGKTKQSAIDIATLEVKRIKEKSPTALDEFFAKNVKNRNQKPNIAEKTKPKSADSAEMEAALQYRLLYEASSAESGLSSQAKRKKFDSSMVGVFGKKSGIKRRLNKLWDESEKRMFDSIAGPVVDDIIQAIKEKPEWYEVYTATSRKLTPELKKQFLAMVAQDPFILNSLKEFDGLRDRVGLKWQEHEGILAEFLKDRGDFSLPDVNKGGASKSTTGSPIQGAKLPVPPAVPGPISPETAKIFDQEMPVSLTPTPGVKPVGIPEIMKSLEAAVVAAGGHAPIRTGRFNMNRFRGVFVVNPEVIRINQADNIPTATHEVGHAIQKAVFGSTKSSALKVIPKPARNELVKLGKALYGNTRPNAGYTSEGFVEFIRLKLTTDDAGRMAPNMDKYFEKVLLPKIPKVKEALLDAQALIERYRFEGSVVRAKQQIAETPGRLKEITKTIRENLDYEAMVDEFQALQEISTGYEEVTGKKLSPGEDPFILASWKRGTAGAVVEDMIERGMQDIAGNPTGAMGLREALAPIKGQNEKFGLYLFGRRGVELWSKGKNPGIQLEDAKFLVRHFESPEFQLAAQNYYEWNRGLLEYVRQSNPALSPLIDHILRTSKDYAPFARLIDPKYASSVAASLRTNPLYRQHGSGRKIKPIFETTLQNAARLVTSAHKNLVLQSVVKMSQVEGMGFLVEEVQRSKQHHQVNIENIRKKLEEMGVDTGEIAEGTILEWFSPATKPKGNDPIVPMNVGGKLRWFHVSPKVYDVLNGLNMYRLPKVLDMFLGMPGRTWRMGTTGLRPSFSLITNLGKDAKTFIAQTQSHANPAKLALAYFSAFREMIRAGFGGKESELVKTFYRLGIPSGQPLGIDIDFTRRAAKRMFKGRVMRVVTTPIETIRELLSIPESVPRLAEMRLIGEEVGWKPGQAMTLDQAAAMAIAAKRVTVDFSAAGRIGKVVNQTVPFFNAQIQGTRVFLRTFKDRPLRSILKGLSVFTMPALINWWKNKDKEWWRYLPWAERYLYTNIDDGYGNVWQIPRPFEWGNVFQVIPEALLDSWYRRDPEGAKAALEHIFTTSNPLDYPVLARIFKEDWDNRIAFFDRPIVPRGEIDLPAGDQRGHYTSKLASWIGDAFPNTASPRRIDAAVRGYFGGVAPDLINALGLGSAGSTRDFEFSDVPVAGRLARRGGIYSPQSQTLADFYDVYTNYRARSQSPRWPLTGMENEYWKYLQDSYATISEARKLADKIDNRKARQSLYRNMSRQAEKVLKMEPKPR